MTQEKIMNVWILVLSIALISCIPNDYAKKCIDKFSEGIVQLANNIGLLWDQS